MSNNSILVHPNVYKLEKLSFLNYRAHNALGAYTKSYVSWRVSCRLQLHPRNTKITIGSSSLHFVPVDVQTRTPTHDHTGT